MLKEIRYAMVLRFFNLFGIFVLGGIAFIGWMAYWVENVSFGLPVACVLLVIGVAWLAALIAAPLSVCFDADRLIIHRWTGAQTMDYAAVRSISQSWAWILMRTEDGPIFLPKLFANDDARLFRAMEYHIPVARQVRAERLAPVFPIVVAGKVAAPLLLGLSGLTLLGGGLVAGVYLLLHWAEPGVLEPVSVMLLLAGLGLGVLLLSLVMWAYPYRTSFTDHQMTQHFLVRSIVQPMQGLADIQSGYEMRVSRGISRQVYFISFQYVNGETFRWTPNEFSFPIDYVDAEAAGLVSDLEEQLLHAYFPNWQGTNTI